MTKKTYAVTVIKKIAYVDVIVVDAETQEDANDIALAMAPEKFGKYPTEQKDGYEVGSVVSINV